MNTRILDVLISLWGRSSTPEAVRNVERLTAYRDALLARQPVRRSGA